LKLQARIISVQFRPDGKVEVFIQLDDGGGSLSVIWPHERLAKLICEQEVQP
jgi:hypothetical protein